MSCCKSRNIVEIIKRSDTKLRMTRGILAYDMDKL